MSREGEADMVGLLVTLCAIVALTLSRSARRP
jgi:hypothetical protein